MLLTTQISLNTVIMVTVMPYSSPIDSPLSCPKKNRKSGVVGAVIPVLQKQKQAGLCEFNTSLVYL
jgi:pseudouridine-5'-phosphate glycosidase